MLNPGQEVDRYVVTRLVGEGGMAMVFHVTHKHLESEHVLKVITNIHPSFKHRLLREGRAQAGLRHPNLVRVTDVVTVGDSVGLVMDYVDGPSLREWMDYNDPSMEEALDLFRGIVRGVQHAHAHGVVHRDLKPGNVLVDKQADVVVPRVSDFGLAKANNYDGKDDDEAVYSLWDEPKQLTKTGAAIGTPEYMSPEQIRDSARVDRRSDLFSLGCILYELVCGRRAFDGDVIDIYNAVSSGTFTPTREIAPKAPEVLHGCIEQLLKVSPDERLSSCSELLRLLDQVDAPPPNVDPDPNPAPISAAALPEHGATRPLHVTPIALTMGAFALLATLVSW